MPGTFRLPAGTVVVTYADPQTNVPVNVRLPTEPLVLSGVLPRGAEALDPFIAAESLELTQTVDGQPDAIVPGDSLVRTVAAAICGAPPMLPRELIPSTASDGISEYSDAPALDERDAHGQRGGTPHGAGDPGRRRRRPWGGAAGLRALVRPRQR